MEKKVVGALAGAGILLNVFAFRLPVVQDVDVVVAGGSSAAVAAAVAAKQAGATRLVSLGLISCFIVYLFSTAKLQIVAEYSKFLGYSEAICDEWHH